LNRNILILHPLTICDIAVSHIEDEALSGFPWVLLFIN